MGRSVRDIMALYTERRNGLSAMHAAALAVKNAYYGDVVIPTAEMDRADRPLTANLVYQGGEQRAMRVASTMPNVMYPSTRPGFENHDSQARTRRLVNLHWWDDDRLAMKMMKRARHLVYYATTPSVIRPDFRNERPSWQIRNPITTFAPRMDTGDVSPPDCIFTVVKSYSWLRYTYPDRIGRLNTSGNESRNFTLIEYVDHDEFVLAVLGDKADADTYVSATPGATNTRDGEIVELERIPNRAGVCPATIPGRIGLDDPRGEFDGVLGLWQAQARLMALTEIGMQRAVFPEMWMVDHPNQIAEIKVHADPMRGVTGHIGNGDIKLVHPLPEAFTTNLIDRLERAFRIESGVPAELGGEAASNIRTGRRGDQVLSAVLDFPIREEQELLAIAMSEENRIAIAVDKGYFKGSKVIPVSGTGGEIEYDPAKLWTTDRNYVRYAMAGVDAQGLTVNIGQRIGMGTMSVQTGMEMDPYIDDPQAEQDRIMIERIQAGLQTSISTLAADPNYAVTVARVAKKLREGETEIEDAMIAIDEAIKAQQAEAQAAQQQQMGQAPPEQMPGMANPTIAPPAEGLGNLTQLLSQLHRGQQQGQTPAPQLQAV